MPVRYPLSTPFQNATVAYRAGPMVGFGFALSESVVHPRENWGRILSFGRIGLDGDVPGWMFFLTPAQLSQHIR